MPLKVELLFLFCLFFFFKYECTTYSLGGKQSLHYWVLRDHQNQEIHVL